MKARLSLKYFVNNCLCKQIFVFNSPQALSKLIYWTISVTARSFIQFQLEIRAIKFQKSAKTCFKC